MMGEAQAELVLLPQAATPPSLFAPLVVDKQLTNTQQLADGLVSGIDISQGCDLKQQLIAVETQLIQKALDATLGNVSKAADLLCVRRTTLIEKIKKYQL